MPNMLLLDSPEKNMRHSPWHYNPDTCGYLNFGGLWLQDIGSGSSAMHNTLLLIHPEKSVLHAPWCFYSTYLCSRVEGMFACTGHRIGELRRAQHAAAGLPREERAARVLAHAIMIRD